MEKDSMQAAKSLQMKYPCSVNVSDKNRKRSKGSDQGNYDSEIVEKSEGRFLFDVTCEELNVFKEGECPVNIQRRILSGQ